MQIDHLIKRKLWLAPLAGYTDQAFRRICKDYAADVLVSEMVSADGLIRDSGKTLHYVLFTPCERPFGVQLFGSDPLTIAKAAEFLIPYSPDFIDINMGCPVKKVIRRGAGSALMREPQNAAKIVLETKKALSGRIPLSVKFRSGWDEQNLNYMDFGKLMQDSGADFLCLHPRTTKQMFGGKSNWDHIAQLKRAISIPLIGNGDINSLSEALAMYENTACDSIMIGRGALGKPWIFRQITAALTDIKAEDLSPEELRDTLIKHIDYALENKRESRVIREIRAHICFYTKGIEGGADLRRKINQSNSYEELISLIRLAAWNTKIINKIDIRSTHDPNALC